MTDQQVYLTLKDLQRRYRNVSKMTIWRWVQLGSLPKPIKFSNAKNARGYWRLGEVEASEAARVAKDGG
jgi:hypothetical protein